MRSTAPNGRPGALEYDDEQLADVFARAVRATGHGPTSIGRTLGIPRQHVQQLMNGSRPPNAAGLRSALADLSDAGAEASRLMTTLWRERRITAESASHVRAIGEKAMRAGASLIEWAEQVERERVISIEEEDR